MCFFAIGLLRSFDESSHAEYGIIESLLILILQPDEHDSMYICSVILELCKLAPSLIPPVLAAGIALSLRHG